MERKEKVGIAMSGGVDSSVAAALLMQSGYDVFGVMLRLWSEPGMEFENQCCTPDSISQARRVAAKFDIPFYVVDSRDIFYNQVVEYYLQGNMSGITPNPCMICNQSIRWGFMLNRMVDMGASLMATGHYARVVQDDGVFHLHQGVDHQKDQSYVLSRLNQEQLGRTILPLGELRKEDVRHIARELGLSVAERRDSQDLCFLGNYTSQEFLINHHGAIYQKGDIVDTQGEIIGKHDGLNLYTIGQRKGIKIASSEPFYVIKKDVKNNHLVVGRKDELGFTSLTAGEMNWISAIPGDEFNANVKIRYKATPVDGKVKIIDRNRIEVKFDKPLRDITPGQFAVLYQGERVLGSGVIQMEGDK